jgi:hypothetical protein
MNCKCNKEIISDIKNIIKLSEQFILNKKNFVGICDEDILFEQEINKLKTKYLGVDNVL